MCVCLSYTDRQTKRERVRESLRLAVRGGKCSMCQQMLHSFLSFVILQHVCLFGTITREGESEREERRRRRPLPSTRCYLLFARLKSVTVNAARVGVSACVTCTISHRHP